MSLQKIRTAFEVMDKCEAWSIQLLRIKTSKSKGTEYAAMSVNITPQGKLVNIVEEIIEKKFSQQNKVLGNIEKFA